MMLYNLLFPAQCACCGKTLPLNRSAPGCRQCYRLLTEEYQFFLSKNHFLQKQFPDHRFLFANVGLHKKLLKQAKLAPSFRAFLMISELSIEEYLTNQNFRHMDCVVPIPSHISSLFHRGFSPAGEFATRLSQAFGISVEHRALKMARRTKKQAKLYRAERMLNVAGSFSAAPHKVRDKRILLVDDILTTGATLKEAKKTLLFHGAKEVQTFSMAVSPLKVR